MKRFIKILGTGLIGTSLLIGGVAMAKGGPMGSPVLKEVLRSLDLDEEQKALVQEMKEDAKAEREDKKSFHESRHATMLDELSKETPNSRVLHKLIDDGFEMAAESAHNALDDLLELHATFTPEQRETFVDELERAHVEREQMRAERKDGRKGAKDRPADF